MKIRKIRISLAVALAITAPVFAYRNIYEPESDKAVSYSTYSIEKHLTEIVFVKYAGSSPNLCVNFL